MYNSDLISVVVVNFNHSKYLPRSIQAIINQKTLPYQLIISDDNSSDNSKDVINYYATKHNWIIPKINKVNLGVNGNVNSSIDYINTKYCIFAAADDFLESDYIFRVHNLIKKNGDTGLVCSPTYQFSEAKGVEGFYGSTFISHKETCLNPNQFKITFLRHGSFFKGATSTFNMKIFRENGGYDIQIGSYADTFISYICGIEGGCIYDPKPGAYCQRFYSGYASSSMRSPEKIIEIIDGLKSKKQNIDELAYRKIITPIIQRYFYIFIKNLIYNKENNNSNKLLITLIKFYFIFSPSWRINIFYKINGFIRNNLFKYIFIKKNKKVLKF